MNQLETLFLREHLTYSSSIKLENSKAQYQRDGVDACFGEEEYLCMKLIMSGNSYVDMMYICRLAPAGKVASRGSNYTDICTRGIYVCSNGNLSILPRTTGYP